MPDHDLEPDVVRVSDDACATHIPIIEEQAHITKRAAATEHVTVRTFTDEEQIVLRDEVRRGHVEVTRIPVDREVAEPPLIRTEGDITIVPILEERLVVEKRLFLVEEVHLQRRTSMELVDVPATVRRTRVEIDREPVEQFDLQEE